MKDVAGLLHKKLEATSIPIFGVAIPDEANKATWRIDFRPEATAQQQSDAQAIVSAFVVDTTVMQYVRLHHTHARTFMKALHQLELGVNAHTVGGDALTSLRSALTSAGAIINTLPAAFTNELAKERDLQGVGGAIGSMTLALCQRAEIVFRNWLNSRIMVAIQAEDILE